ncbi:hypothetical protein [Actinophytocola glycyrrhizae]|uniref:Uncharacterized protein n=1 Tax=Actinophytocola glycyrrhizae TaxID=2044873 RepID=A0ABV9SAB3_9PSEU
MATDDPNCAVAHGEHQAPPEARTLVAVFASPVADVLLRYAGDLGYRTVLVNRNAAACRQAGWLRVLTRAIAHLGRTG